MAATPDMIELLLKQEADIMVQDNVETCSD